MVFSYLSTVVIKGENIMSKSMRCIFCFIIAINSAASWAFLNELPREVVEIILLQLSPEDQKNISLVSKAFENASEDFWIMSINNFFGPKTHEQKPDGASYLAFFREKLAKLSKANLDYFLTNKKLKGTTKQDLYLAGANLTANWSAHNIAFQNTFQNASLQGANLRGANLQNASISGVNFEGADLSDATLSGHFSNCNFSNAKFVKANLSKAIIINNKFIGSDLSGANLSGAVLSGSNFQNASLMGANLINSNWDNFTNWKDAKIQDAIFGDNTESITTEPAYDPVSFNTLTNQGEYLLKNGAIGTPKVINSASWGQPVPSSSSSSEDYTE